MSFAVAFSQIRSGSTSNPLNIDDNQVFATIETVLDAAKEEMHLDKKAELYNSAFQTILSTVGPSGLPPALKERLFQLFELYAANICYCQESKEKTPDGKSVDPEEGFKKSARLMELSINLQLHSLNLGGEDFSLNRFQTIEELIQSLFDQDPLNQSHQSIAKISVDPLVLRNSALDQNLLTTLNDSLIRLAYSYQNMGALNTPAQLELHEKLDSLIALLIDGSPVELIGYTYNRAVFMAGLRKPNDFQAKFESYGPVTELIESSLPENDPERVGRLSQINNMKGLMLVRHEPPRLEEAEPYFRKALLMRSSLITSGLPEEAWLVNTRLQSNIRSSLIHCLVNNNPNEMRLREADEQVDALRGFLQHLEEVGDNNAYNKGYVGAIEKVHNARKAIQGF